jgi:hypothetical protein
MNGVDFMAVYHICTVCETRCAEHETYCKKCGTWLLSTTHPPRRIDTLASVRQKASSISKSIFSIFIIALIYGGYYYYNNTLNPDSFKLSGITIPLVDRPITFGDTSNGDFTVSQLQVKPSKPLATAEIRGIKTIDYSFELVLVCYDKSGQRVGLASSLFPNGLTAGQITTINFTFQDVTNMVSMSSVQIQVNPLSPLQLVQRSAEMLKSTTSK